MRRMAQDAYRTYPPTDARPHLSAASPLTGHRSASDLGLSSANASGPPTQREFWARVARKIRSDIPDDADDFTLYTIATANRDTWAQKTYQDMKRDFVDVQWRSFVKTECGEGEGAERAALEIWARFMDKVIEASGEKPLPGDSSVEYVKIPGTRYFLRFWPGSFTSAEYCMDFMQANDHNELEAVNVPPEYAIWAIPDTQSSPWLSPTCVEITSIERAHGIQPCDIKPGEEKYLLRDGMTCQLVRGSEALFRFKVPSRVGVYGGGEASPNNPILPLFKM
ncbi:hypothetical protein PYCCODRAFT_1471269 [Trametes coccinea BRFM310]|uniref:Uncharacterized protein n=1 Tax=Trametes coccinea (strain BRFM310) TaxID=1353009 RepID=A0A1Y2IBZ1_TRAC3|nr:hypothetical protein PYCCODRAFT_1471269 [Trametes coccinea BRFM310]